MGMFDYLRCDYVLPIDGFSDSAFQTKALGRNLDRYVIGVDGRLRHNGEEIAYSGAIHFYDFDGEAWIEFAALFDKGVLEARIVLVKNDCDASSDARTDIGAVRA